MVMMKLFFPLFLSLSSTVYTENPVSNQVISEYKFVQIAEHLLFPLFFRSMLQNKNKHAHIHPAVYRSNLNPFVIAILFIFIFR